MNSRVEAGDQVIEIRDSVDGAGDILEEAPLDNAVAEKSISAVKPAPEAPPARFVWVNRAIWALPFAAGLVLPATGALNAQSSAILGSSYWAVATTYTIGSILTVTWALFTGKKKTKREGFRDLGHFLRSGRWHWACLLGGVLGSAQNIISAEVSPVLGTGLMTTGILLGQVIMSMICDATGFVWAKKIGVHLYTMIGGLIVCCGCVLYPFALFLDGLDDGREDQASVGRKIEFILFALLYGITNCLQAGVGGQMGRQIGHFRRASAWAFSSGMAICYIIAVIENPNPGHANITGSDWWKFCAAPVSIFYSGVAAIVPAYLSFSAVFACIVAGQLVGSTILDANGWLGLLKRNLDLYNVFGILVVMVGVVLVTWGKRKQMAHNTATTQVAQEKPTQNSTKADGALETQSLGSFKRDLSADNKFFVAEEI